MSRPICFLDVETTGVEPETDRIIQLGVVVLDPDKPADRKTWVQMFNPGMPIPPESTAVHHITDEMVKGCPPFRDYAARILKSISGKDLGGYNLRRLDLPILDAELRRCDLKLDLTGVAVIDCFAIFAKQNPRDLAAALRHYCDREITDQHDALADAAATADVFLSQLQRHPELAALDRVALADYAVIGEYKPADIAGKLYYNAENRLCFAFGKNKGVPVAFEPRYAIWMVRATDPPFPGSTVEMLREELSANGHTITGPGEGR